MKLIEYFYFSLLQLIRKVFPKEAYHSYHAVLFFSAYWALVGMVFWLALAFTEISASSLIIPEDKVWVTMIVMAILLCVNYYVFGRKRRVIQIEMMVKSLNEKQRRKMTIGTIILSVSPPLSIIILALLRF
ncbi:MAG: hypothetical protein H8D23_13150 [Candidatus Brocadiales bacterium]|nr:hypothetical protein [Candidatus Brocadiales bacterium]